MSDFKFDVPPMRCGSPLRDKINESSEIYQTALRKLYNSAWKFDRERNGNLLKTIESRELDKELFRQTLRSGMNCKLTVDELESLMPYFENKGYVDGCEFLLLFYRLRFDFRSKLLTDRIAKERHIRTAAQELKAKRQFVLEQKTLIKVSYDFSEEEYKTAMEKVTQASVRYDRLMPGTVQLDAFDCEYMRPDEFREQLKLVFNLTLTTHEFGALIKHLNKEDESDVINCASFLVMFLRLGFEERSRRIRSVWAEKKRINEEKEKKKEEHQAVLEKKNSLKCSFDFTPQDKERALVKLRDAARLYDKTTPGAMSMKSFDVAFMPPHVFKEQLKRIFNLKLTPPELGALMEVFDDNGDGHVSCQEFSKTFLALGFAERDRERNEFLDRQKRSEEVRIAKVEKKQKVLESKNALNVNFEYSEDDFQSAMHKMTEAAWRFDKNMPAAPNLDAFESQEMEPHVFKEQMKRTFNMKLNPEELGALMSYYDAHGSGKIICADFLIKFVTTGIQERERRLAVWRQHQHEQNQLRSKKALEKKALAEEKLTLKMEDYTETDFQAALSKLTEAAIKYNRDGAGAVGLDAFEAVSMQPHVFKEQLKLVFGVKLNIPELAAVMSYFDKDEAGNVVCKDFLIEFFRTGFEERARIRNSYRDERERRRVKAIVHEETRQREINLKAMADVNYDFTEKDFDTALSKLIFVCHQFDRRQLGPAGFAAFTSDGLTPSEFREMMKRTFNLKLIPCELGALVTYFDSGMKGTVNCTTFLNSFVQIRVQCEEFKGKPGEAEQLKAYHAQLKDAYIHRIHRRVQKGGDAALRPWRSHNAPPESTASAVTTVTKKIRPYPKTPIEKLKLRVLVAKSSGLLDLASKQSWPELAQWDVDCEDDQSVSLSEATDTEKSYFLAMEAVGDTGNNEDYDECEDAATFPNITNNSNTNEVEIVNTDGVEQQTQALDLGEGVVLDLSVKPNTGRSATAAVLEAQPEVIGEEYVPETGVRELAMVLTPGHGRKVVDFRLSVIPVEVFRMTKLKELWLCNNMISSIPAQICELRHLKVFSVSNNRIRRLPPEVCLLVNLHRFLANGNALTGLPDIFGGLVNLTELNLSDNQFVKVPSVLTKLTSLIVLNLSGNQLSTIPPTMLKLRSLSQLDLGRNPELANEPIEVLKSMHWVDVDGSITIPADSEKACFRFKVTKEDEEDLEGMIRGRGQAQIAAKLRQKKKAVLPAPVHKTRLAKLTG